MRRDREQHRRRPHDNGWSGNGRSAGLALAAGHAQPIMWYDRSKIYNLAGGTLSLQVRDRLVRMLPEGEPSAEQVASSLHLSLRSLQRRLAEEDSSYEQLLLQTREELARSYLQDPRHAISEIAYLLGYADASCFTRAFRRWTGMAPSVYRAGGLRDQG